LAKLQEKLCNRFSNYIIPYLFFQSLLKEEFEDTKEVNRIRRTDNKWPKEKVQKDKQRSTQHTHKTKDRVTHSPQKTGGELRCSGRVIL